MDLFPGGYVFSTLIFWSVVALVAVGTSIVAVLLLAGLMIMALEAVGRA